MASSLRSSPWRPTSISPQGSALPNLIGSEIALSIVEALLTAYDTVGIKLPLVVRLEGTNVEKARAMLKESGKKIIAATDLTDAAKKVVATLGA